MERKIAEYLIAHNAPYTQIDRSTDEFLGFKRKKNMPGQATITAFAEDGTQLTQTVTNISQFIINCDKNQIQFIQYGTETDFDTKNISSISISIVNGIYYATIS